MSYYSKSTPTKYIQGVVSSSNKISDEILAVSAHKKKVEEKEIHVIISTNNQGKFTQSLQRHTGKVQTFSTDDEIPCHTTIKKVKIDDEIPFHTTIKQQRNIRDDIKVVFVD